MTSTAQHIVLVNDFGPCEHADENGHCRGSGIPEELYVVGTPWCSRYEYGLADCDETCNDERHEALLA